MDPVDPQVLLEANQTKDDCTFFFTFLNDFMYKNLVVYSRQKLYIICDRTSNMSFIKTHFAACFRRDNSGQDTIGRPWRPVGSSPNVFHTLRRHILLSCL